MLDLVLRRWWLVKERERILKRIRREMLPAKALPGWSRSVSVKRSVSAKRSLSVKRSLSSSGSAWG